MENTALKIIKRNIEDSIKRDLERIGIHYRLHSRIKELDSLEEKINSKGDGYYSIEGKKVQDIIGFRITTFFIDDVKMLWDYFFAKTNRVDDEYDKADTDIFKPLRKNLICRMTDEDSETFEELKQIDAQYLLVDNTYEIQFRTTLSEGWHEVDHSLRYKCKTDWKDYPDEDRMLNGIFASLETNDRALKALFDDLAYYHYKKNNWEAMLRMKFRLNFVKKEMNEGICDYLTQNKNIAKAIFRIDRLKLLNKIANSGLYIPVSFNNLIYLINYLYIKEQALKDQTPENIIENFSSCEID